jgi:hypothetical protein
MHGKGMSDMKRQEVRIIQDTQTHKAAYLVTAHARDIFLLVLTLLVLCAATASAQNIQHTKNSVGLGLRSPFKVNPATNALELQIPLGPTAYPQRGGASVSPTLDYSSKIWRMAYTGATYSGGPPPNQLTATLVAAKFAESSRMGWTFSLGAPWVDTPSNENYDAWGNPVSQCVSGGEPPAASSTGYRFT